MSFTQGWGRRITTMLLVAITVGVGTVVSTGVASASPCEKPNELGNATVYVGGVVTVGVDQNNIGTTEHDVIACVDVAGFVAIGAVDVTDPNPSAPGVQVAADACVPGWWNCGFPFTIGSEVVPPSTVGVPSTSVDPPADGNGSVGVNTGTGNTACAWALWASAPLVSTCGGNVATGGGDVPGVTPDPDPIGLADYMVGRVLGTPAFVDACLWLMNGDFVNGGIGCALIFATQYVVIPALMVVDWL